MTIRLAAVVLAVATAFQALLASTPSESASPETARAAASRDATGGGAQLLGRTFIGRDTALPGVVVVAYASDGPPRYRVTSTDAKGWFRFDAIEDGAWTVELRKEGYRTIVKNEIPLRAPFRAVLELPMELYEPATQEGVAEAGIPGSDETASVRGVVFADDRESVGEARVRLRRLRGAERVAVALTGPDGRFAFDGLDAGRWHLEIIGAGFLPIRAALEIRGEVALDARLVHQPAAYEADPEDLMPLEEPIPPPP